ncbi:MAG: hypothetical protein Q8O32_00860 [bacterium]|nr:hypothetical protein [bacterium]
MIKIKHYLWPLILLFPSAVLAGLAETSGLNSAAAGTGLIIETDTNKLIAGIINSLLAFLGMLFTLLIIYGGFKWMTSQGKTEQVDEAKKIIQNSTIGLAVVVFSYVIVWFVLGILEGTTQSEDPSIEGEG